MALKVVCFFALAIVTTILCSALPSSSRGMAMIIGLGISAWISSKIQIGPMSGSRRPDAGGSSVAGKVRGIDVTLGGPVRQSRPDRKTESVAVGARGYAIPKMSKEDAPRFLDAEDSVIVQGVEINGPVYIGRPERVGQDADPAVIDPKARAVAGHVADFGYWPSYAGCSPAQRYAYLKWLSEGRDSVADLSFVYLYFYGFERYVLRDAANDSKDVRDKRLTSIVAETNSLRALIGENGGFSNYSGQLLDIITLLYREETLEQRKGMMPPKESLAVRYVIARYANEHPSEKIDPDWALAWLASFGPYLRNMSAQRYPIVRAFFGPAYLAQTKGGIVAPSCKKRLDLTARPASRGLLDSATLPTPEDWTDPTGLARPITKLTKVYESVSKNVNAFARAAEKGDKLRMLAAWPSGVPTENHPQIHRLVEAVLKVLSSEKCTAGALGHLFWEDVPAKVSALEAKQLMAAIATAGHVMVPHPLLTKVSLTRHDTVLSYQGVAPEALSPAGEQVALSIHLGAMLAMADGEVHEAEIEALQRVVDAHSNAQERDYLGVLLKWRLTCPPSTAGIKTQIDQLTDAKKSEVARQLVVLARADGALPASEIKQLEKLFKRLGLDASVVTQMLHATASIATPAAAPSSQPGAGFGLDEAEIKRHAAQTKEIQSVLGNIFTDSPDGESEEINAADEIPAETAGEWHQGILDTAHADLAQWLLGQDTWEMAVIEEKCAALGLLPHGALERINEAAFDALGDGLLEIGDVVEIYRDMVPA